VAAPYYEPSGTPANNAQGSSSDIRTELGLIETALDKMPALTANNIVVVNSGGTALTSVTGDLVTTDPNSTTNTKLGAGAGGVLIGGSIDNTAFGNGALSAGTTCARTTAFGKNAAKSTVASGNNTAIGFDALRDSVSGGQNVAVGANCLTQCTSALNTAVGEVAMFRTVGGTRNTAMGNEAYETNISGDDTTAIGHRALAAATSDKNTALGSFAGDAITTGIENVMLGYNVDASLSAGSGQVTIGSSVQCDQNNQITIGNSSGTIKNEFDTDNAWTQSSDKRKKTNIKPAKLGLNFICDLTPVTYNLKPASEWPQEWGVPSDTKIDTERTMHSFLAQDVLQAIKKSGVNPDTFAGWSEDSQGQRISKEMFIFPLVNAVKELVQQNKELLQKIEKIEGKL
jgi:hypothetical protein